MMFGDPVTHIAEVIDVLRQIERIAQRDRAGAAGGDGCEVEDGEGKHAELR